MTQLQKQEMITAIAATVLPFGGTLCVKEQCCIWLSKMIIGDCSSGSIECLAQKGRTGYSFQQRHIN